MFLDILEFRIEEKNRENCFETMVSDSWEKILCGHKTTFRKKLKKTKKN